MKRLISLLITVLLALPALTTVAYEGDLYFYDFNNYTGQNIFTCSGTDLQPTIIGENAGGFARSYSKGIGGREGTDGSMIFSAYASNTSTARAYFGMWADKDNKYRLDWKYYGSEETSISLTVQFDVYNATKNGSVSVIGAETAGNPISSQYYRLDNIDMSREKWHTVAVEFIREKTSDDALCITNYYLDGRKIKKEVTQNNRWARYPYLLVSNPAGEVGYFAVDNFRVYQNQYDGVTEMYRNTFDEGLDEIVVETDNEIIDFETGVFGKNNENKSLVLVCGEKPGEGSVRFDTTYNEKITYEISVRDSGQNEHQLFLGHNVKEIKLNDIYWHKISVTVDGENVKYYVDGELIDEREETINAFKWTVKHTDTSPSKVFFDDFRVYKGGIDAEGNNVEIPLGNGFKVINNNIKLFDEKLKTSDFNGTVYENEEELEKGNPLQSEEINEGNILVITSQNGEAFAYYTFYFDSLIVRKVEFAEKDGKNIVRALVCAPEKSSVVCVAVCEKDGRICGVNSSAEYEANKNTDTFIELNTSFVEAENIKVFFINNWNDCKVIRNKTYSK